MCLGTFNKERKLHRKIKKTKYFKRNNKYRSIILQTLDVQVFIVFAFESDNIVKAGNKF